MPDKFIDWSNERVVGVARIDSEHRIFAELINAFGHRIVTGVDLPAAIRSLREIAKYAEFHFVSEENLMVETHYPRLREHAAIHQRLLQELASKSMALAAQEIGEQQILDLLVHWFVEHTAREDPLFAKHCRERRG